LEFEKIVNVVEGKETKEDEFEDNVDCFEAIVANQKIARVQQVVSILIQAIPSTC
jgi:CRISPR/Cas system CSM-associated protein Csm2 small subunit